MFGFKCTVLKRSKKNKNELINAEEAEDHYTDISSVGEYRSFAVPERDFLKE